jgi:hypothetical protein
MVGELPIFDTGMLSNTSERGFSGGDYAQNGIVGCRVAYLLAADLSLRAAALATAELLSPG